ncbi:MAG: GNAT family N-acetyltransferase [Chiayiivirga sp.]|jgi:ribosomal-protein-alanine N-acetyltransferase|uniref:GNAT family N-acetyltransferase n=1 Tax=Chiayiivirga sp. TaxID=2041042 RepID=UPI0025BAF478|nr:GNAT family N-acetyltransferase [Chiayiivirga sp.]MCI1710946.1 GNAT family N-acetyltransferase [Chiayiivirga sp.]MCI1728259.1 GNAT family N-acetyltransferase [Chiayiivirga sp.]
MQRGPAALAPRRARASDLPALLAVEAHFPGDRLGARQFRHHLRNPRARLRVLAGAGVIAGYSLILLRAGSRRARLYSIALDPAWRGRGFGALLLADAEVQARRAGASAMRLEVRADNLAATALYEARGYRRIVFLPGYYEDGGDGWRYEKSFA